MWIRTYSPLTASSSRSYESPPPLPFAQHSLASYVTTKLTPLLSVHDPHRCIATPDPALAPPTGTSGSNNCDQNANFGSGCTVVGGDAGSVFNEKGGGAWVMAFEVSHAYTPLLRGGRDSDTLPQWTLSSRRRGSPSGNTPARNSLHPSPRPLRRSTPPPSAPPSSLTRRARATSPTSSGASR